MKHLAEPRDIAEAALFLASEGARYITGINQDVNGGNLRAPALLIIGPPTMRFRWVKPYSDWVKRKESPNSLAD